MGKVVVAACPHESIVLFGVVRVILEVTVDAAVMSLCGSVLCEDSIAIVEGESVHEGCLIYPL
jgi:hypothetical protein